jgi:hypothetical protein
MIDYLRSLWAFIHTTTAPSDEARREVLDCWSDAFETPRSRRGDGRDHATTFVARQERSARLSLKPSIRFCAVQNRSAEQQNPYFPSPYRMSANGGSKAAVATCWPDVCLSPDSGGIADIPQPPLRGQERKRPYLLQTRHQRSPQGAAGGLRKWQSGRLRA